MNLKALTIRALVFRETWKINSLIKLSQAKGSNAGFVLNFRNDKEGEPYSEDTFYISISNFCKFYNETDKKSISKLDIV